MKGAISTAALLLALFFGAGPVQAEEGDVGPQEFGDLATARSQIYEGFVGLIEGFQDGGNISGWAEDMLDAAFGIAQGTVETIVYATTFSIPVGGLEMVIFAYDAWGQANVMMDMYDDISFLMNNWSDGFIAGDQQLIWNNNFMYYSGKPDDLKQDLTALQIMTAEEAVLWAAVLDDLMQLNDVDELLAQQAAKVEEALGPATYMYNTATQWKESGSVPNTFVCQFGEYSSCKQLIDTNYSVTKSIYEFLLTEQAYLAGFLTVLEPVEVECLPGSELPGEPCGNCGNNVTICTEEAKWATDVVCMGSGECAPGATEAQPCGNCGQQQRVCSAACTFGEWEECANQGECTPGDAEEQDCGDCGTKVRGCSDACMFGEWDKCDDPCAVMPEPNPDVSATSEIVAQADSATDPAGDLNPSADSLNPVEPEVSSEADQVQPAADAGGDEKPPAGDSGCSAGAVGPAGSPLPSFLLLLLLLVGLRRKHGSQPEI